MGARTALVLAATLTTPLARASAQSFDDVAKAWVWEQQVRKECRAIVDREPVDADAVRSAIDRLDALVAWLASPETVTLAAGHSLRFQPEDLCVDLAIAHARLGAAPEVAAALEDLVARLVARNAPASTYVFQSERFLRRAPAELRADPRVAAAVRKLLAHDPWARHRSPELSTPFRESLPEDERLAGLALFWSEVKYNFANFDLVPDLDWDAAFCAAIPEVRAAADTLAYYRALQKLCALLRDGHTSVTLPFELNDRASARPPLRTAVVEGRVFVAGVMSPQLRDLGLAERQEIVRIDGQPVVEYAEREFGPFVAASTPQDRTTQLLVRQLLLGPAERPVTLTIAEPGKEAHDVAVPRTGHQIDPPRPNYALSMLPGNVALVSLNTFADAAVASAFAGDLERILAADGLILDVRENGGGSSDVGYAILAHLTDELFLGSRWRTPQYQPAFRAWNRLPSAPSQDPSSNAPAGGKHFTGPVAVLISARTYSAAEDFAVAFDAMHRGALVGEPSGGSTGQPLTVQLPGGGAARICTKRDSYPDGRQFVGVGVQPTVASSPTIVDLLAGRDTVLERALQELKPAK